ncbi:hypothetical protein CWC22_021640 [Pseudoalteromonas rubra]|uniref:Lipase chaperone n=1 Tax=Pseudoalteromonas rubra TaxID=43658 RepID=A0A5S3USP2_9GAMM|nr:lipase secretion chaperone [Pseudoalteromonas rubra]QPB85615.1 hypothetical protein CWC22_021640 [Pseudoalteromonas rubra]
MRYWRLLSLSCVGLSVCLWTLLLERDPEVTTEIVTGSARVVTETPHQIKAQFEAVMPAEPEHCSVITRAHKHQLDDWVLLLQNEQLEQHWAQQTHRLPPCLRDIAHDYMAYKQALTQVDTNLTMHERFEALQTLQGLYFSAEVIAAWFEGENRWHAQTLARWQILSDKTLSEQTRTELIDAHISQLPQTERQTIEATQTLITLKHSWHNMDYNQLSARYGDAAAQRLMQVRHNQSSWTQRVSEYKQRRSELLEKGASDEALTSLTRDLFTQNERKRLSVILSQAH